MNIVWFKNKLYSPYKGPTLRVALYDNCSLLYVCQTHFVKKRRVWSLNLTASFPWTPYCGMQELEKSMVINHIPPKLREVLCILEESSCSNSICHPVPAITTFRPRIVEMMFLAWHLFCRSMHSSSFFLFMFMVWHPSPELIQLATFIIFQLFSYFFRIDATLGVISPFLHMVWKWYALVWYNLRVTDWGWLGVSLMEQLRTMLALWS